MTIQKSKSAVVFVIALQLPLMQAPAAQALLILEIRGVPGSGQTTWTFSGSDTAGAGGDFDDDANINNSDAGGSHWDLGEYTDSPSFHDFQLAAISSTATLTIDGTTRNIEDAYLDSDGAVGAGGDDIGVGVSGSTNFNFVTGNLVSWLGSMLVAIDINDMDNAGLPSTLTSSTYGDTTDTLDLEIRFSAVPEPGALGLVLWSLALLVAAPQRTFTGLAARVR